MRLLNAIAGRSQAQCVGYVFKFHGDFNSFIGITGLDILAMSAAVKNTVEGRSCGPGRTVRESLMDCCSRAITIRGSKTSKAESRQRRRSCWPCEEGVQCKRQ
jgi:hypothetical protein